jgi:hypothetical protein
MVAGSWGWTGSGVNWAVGGSGTHRRAVTDFQRRWPFGRWRTMARMGARTVGTRTVP